MKLSSNSLLQEMIVQSAFFHYHGMRGREIIKRAVERSAALDAWMPLKQKIDIVFAHFAELLHPLPMGRR